MQDIGRDFEAKWDDSLEIKDVTETVLWISADEDVRVDVRHSLCEEWIIVGDVRFLFQLCFRINKLLILPFLSIYERK